MRFGIVCFILLACVAVAQDARAAGFDCGRAISALERTICTDPALSDDDSRLAALYQQTLSSSPVPNHLRAMQRRFLRDREASGAAGAQAMRTVYAERIAELTAELATNRAARRDHPAAALSDTCLTPMVAAGNHPCRVIRTGRIDAGPQSPGLAWQVVEYRNPNDAPAQGGSGWAIATRLADGGLRPILWANAMAIGFEDPAPVAYSAGRLISVHGHVPGTGNQSASFLFLQDGQAWKDVDIFSWEQDLARQLPKGLSAWHGIFPQWDRMTAYTRLWRANDANCCPTGGESDISLGLRGDRIVLLGLRVRPPPRD